MGVGVSRGGLSLAQGSKTEKNPCGEIYNPKGKTKQNKGASWGLSGRLLGFQAQVISVITDISVGEDGNSTAVKNHFWELGGLPSQLMPAWPRNGLWVPYQGRQVHECSA